MTTDRRKSLGRRVVTFLLGTDQPAFIVAAAAVSVAFGQIVIFHALLFSAHVSPPFWQAIGAGMAIGLFMMPFFFMAISRMSSNMSHWEALVTLAAAMLCPLALWRLGPLGLGMNPFFLVAGCVIFVAAAFLTARAIMKWHRSSME